MSLLQMCPRKTPHDMRDGLSVNAECLSDRPVPLAACVPRADLQDIGLAEFREMIAGAASDCLRMNCGAVSPLRSHVFRIGSMVAQEEVPAPFIDHTGNLIRADIVVPDAVADIAGVADIHIRGQFVAGRKRPRKAMRLHGPGVAGGDLTVAVCSDRSRPQPAGVRFLNARPEAINERSGTGTVSEMATGPTTVARQGRMRWLDGVGAATDLAGADRLRAVCTGHGAESGSLRKRRTPVERHAASFTGTLNRHRLLTPGGVLGRDVVSSNVAASCVNYTRSLRVRAA